MSFEDACAAVCAPGTMFEVTDGEIRGVPSKLFALAPPNVRTLFALAAARTDEHLIYEDERWTMPDVLAQAGQIGHALVHRYGIELGDRVALAMRNFPEWITSYVAITSVGGVVVPINAWWQTEEMTFALADSGAKLVFVDEERLRRLTVDGAAVDSQIVVVRPSDPVPEGIDSLLDVLEDGATMPEVDIPTDADVSILYTSGTTGTPKGAVSTHQALIHALMCFAARAQVAALVDPPAEPVDPEAPPIIILAVPLFHVTGLVPVMLGSFLAGGRLVMMHRWDPDRALELIEREKITNFVGVPTMAWDLLEAPTFTERDTSSLKSVGGGGAPMPPELVQRIEDNFSAGRPGLGYGMTETNAYGPQNGGDSFVRKPTSTGQVIPVMEIRVTDAEDNVLPPGETGEIWFKGPSLIRGYWNRPEATADTIVDGWLRSGDLGHVDDEGFVFVSDRVKDMVLRGGENIYCIEVEAAMYEHPAVYECSVYGVPHDRLGEELAAHVMTKPGATIDTGELQSFLGERIAKFKVPQIITVVTESLPRNASGKIMKRDLRDAAAAAQSTD